MCRPFSPWEGCSICWRDEDHKRILLCDRCDAEFHIYCLQPPLLHVPSSVFLSTLNPKIQGLNPWHARILLRLQTPSGPFSTRRSRLQLGQARQIAFLELFEQECCGVAGR